MSKLRIVDCGNLEIHIKRCETVILEGAKKGITEEELNNVLTLASILITLKADMSHASRISDLVDLEELEDKYCDIPKDDEDA